MHTPSSRSDFIDRLTAFHGLLGPADELACEHFASFDADRRDAALRAIADESSVHNGSSAGRVNLGGNAGGGDGEEPTSS